MQNRNGFNIARIPDVLDCLANLSNDEVFTPPAIVNQMLDMLPQELFMSKKTTFLDPCTKSGVFLREITKRLLDNQIPNYSKNAELIEHITKEAIQNAVYNKQLDLNDKDFEEKARHIGDAAIKSHPDSNKLLSFEVDLQGALDHILQEQVFGIAITELTAQLARRSLYCSKDASGRYSIAGATFGVSSEGNIRFIPMRHSWNKANQDGTAQHGASCKYCGASSSNLDRPNDLESHAYEFIHREVTDLIKEWKNMEFTVVCGNPPYHMSVGQEKENYAVAIYDKFVRNAKKLNPKYLLMITPSRWFTGGRGLDDYRDEMLNDDSIKIIVDYPDSKECFPGVDISGGVSYFLRERDYHGMCEFTNIQNGIHTTSMRKLNEFSLFPRFNAAVSIIHKVLDKKEESLCENVSTQTPFGFISTFRGEEKPFKNAVVLLGSKGNTYVKKEQILRNEQWIDKYKLIVSKATAEHAGTPSKDGRFKVISSNMVLPPNVVCTQSYLVLSVFDTEDEVNNFWTYMKTNFFRFLLLQALTSQDISREKFMFVPKQNFSKSWTDAELYEKYDLTHKEIAFIESMIKPME